MIIIRTSVVNTSTPDTAAIRTSSKLSRSCHIRIGSISVLALRRNRDTGMLSNDDMKARNAPASMPEPINGRTTRRNVYQREAPSEAELSSNTGSSCTSVAIVVRITNGTQTIVCPITKVSTETCQPIIEKKIRAERPKARPGKISGDMNKESSRLAASKREPAIPSAAATPSSTDRNVVHVATLKLLSAASCNCQASSRPTYQRSE